MKMGKSLQEEPSSQRPNFFRVILGKILTERTLELPRYFVKEHGKYLSKYVRLKVSTGEESTMELKRRRGQAWLHKGWQDFVDKYSIQCGYFLVFNYKGKSRFNVIILDLSTMEIKYPVSSAKTSNNKAGKIMLTEVKEEYDEILDECRELQLAKESNIGKSRSGQPSFLTKNKSASGIGKNKKASARERVVERAKEFQSPNPHFTVTMQPSYVSMSHSRLYVPMDVARAYFYQKENQSICFKGEDGRAWSVNCTIGACPRRRVSFNLGWDKFVQENDLQVGDACAFELIDKEALAFKVSIFRVIDDEDEVGKDRPLVLTGC